ncbi:MAG: PEP-CTERM sorting domain-containing protein, partial [Phycisphaerae bacterium]|nr:PEP-CTERM sorting domain-containing protein [Phycisphaerae bacterium]
KNLSTGIVVVPGDTNGDQIVDDADLAIFKAQFGGDWNGVALEDPDYDNDGDVDIDDFVVLRANFGTGVVPAPLAPDFSATPEPATMSLLAIGGLLVIRRRRRKA